MRPAVGIESGHLKDESHSMIQLIFKVAHSAARDKILNFFTHSCCGLYLRSENQTFIQANEPPIIAQFPKNMKDPEMAAQWLYFEKTPEFHERLGVCAYNDDLVGISLSHATSDGGYLKYIVDHCLDDKVPEKPPIFPISQKDAFSKILQNLPKQKIHNNETLTKFKWPKYEPVKDNRVAKYIVSEFDTSELKCFSNGKTKGLTESYLVSMILAHSKMNGHFERAGSLICVDLRRYLGPIDNLAMTTMYTGCNVSAPSVKGSTTIGETKRLLREDLNYLINSKACLESLRNFDWGGKDPRTAAPIYSSSGVYNLKYPILDMTLQQRMNSKPFYNIVCAFNYSKISENMNKNNLRIEYSTKVANKPVMQHISDLILYSMKNFDDSMTMDVGVSELMKMKVIH
ncbi:hypothetical protein TRFO_17084 [Tritrichomonas foetus]|uniref:Uncharacterized protein n=1 Tax=Tritrichomonas foetus TaxID=1144522 RepID=A0A1J4KTE3_9EUKA|nr:hypothetical protein TRFO_17084 [Tritrichomonas foetus]|eukprot:OHT12926.1 hypothetical protein TRFO_17084 [Tritrichomonas foetus]